MTVNLTFTDLLPENGDVNLDFAPNFVGLKFQALQQSGQGFIDLNFDTQDAPVDPIDPPVDPDISVNFAVSASFSLKYSSLSIVDMLSTISIGRTKEADVIYCIKSKNKTVNDVTTGFSSKDKSNLDQIFNFYSVRNRQQDCLYRFNISAFYNNDRRFQQYPRRLNTIDKLRLLTQSRLSDLQSIINIRFQANFIAQDSGFNILNKSPLSLDQQHVIAWGISDRATVCTQVYESGQGFIELQFNDNNIITESIELVFDINDIVCITPDAGSNRDYPNNWPPYIPYIPPKNEILQVYFIMHSLSVVVLPSLDEIVPIDIRMNIDIDSYAWSMTMNVAQGIELIRPDEFGVKEIQINIDGHKFNFIVESYTQNEQFVSKSWSVSGRSKTAYLTSPYKLPISATYDSALLASQIVNTELLNSGFTFNYNTVDWLVTANAFSYQNLTTLQAVKRISDAIGGVILPHREDSQITINPRYQDSPWNWSSATPKASLTSDIFISISGNWQPKPDINAVYVGGNNVGVECFVKRIGTAGNKLSRQVVENLMTHQDAGRERGRNIISDRGKQQVVSIKLPILPIGETPGIYDCGDLLEITEGIEIWRGMVIGIEVYIERATATKPMKATQTISIERHYGNT